MDERRQRLRAYRRARRKFACIVYMVSIAWMFLALLQWIVVCLVDDMKDMFVEYYWISVIFFVMAMLMVTFFIFFEKIRFMMGVNWLICVLIVEFAIIGAFALAARTVWQDLLMWFAICLLLIFLFILLGSIIPHDLTLDVVILFVLAFIFLIVTVFFVMMHVVVGMTYAFLAYQVFITIIVLLFVMYHAQTINGGRFAEMRLNDYLLASLILFHDFIVIYLLTFYAQITYKIASGGSANQNTTAEYDDSEAQEPDTASDTGSGGGSEGSGGR